MKASETKLQQILEGTKQYVVPLFQRTYSWSNKEWEVLWSDIIELCEMEKPREHFIGSIVTMPTVSLPEGVAKYLLIDGQQRLTTIFIFLALLRDQLYKKDESWILEEINNTLLVNPYKSDKDFYKLLPTQVDRKSFSKIMDKDPILAEDNITEAYKFFERKVKQSPFDYQEIKKVISNNLSVVSIVLDPEDNPHLVFESLNAKGRPLTQADLIRNFFFMRIHINEQEIVYKQFWKPMHDLLADNLTEFIRHYLMKAGTNVKKSDVYFSLKELVGQDDALSHLKELFRFSAYYSKLLFPEKESKPKLRKALERIKKIEVTTAYPFLLNCYSDYDRNIITEDDFINVLKVIENFMIRRFVCNVPTNQLNKIFPPLYSQITNKENDSFVESLKSILQSKGYPKDNEFKLRLQDTNLYGSGDRVRKTKIILESLEESYNHKEQVPFNDLTIEHIMPQTLNEWWQEHLGEEWEITHELFLHTLGNLTLTAYNSELSNDDYETKRISLSQSHLELNKYFSNKLSWKKEDIIERANILSDKGIEVWPYFGDENTLQNGCSNVTGTTPRVLWILGQNFDVNSWRDVLEETMNTVSELEPEKFEILINKFPRLIGRDKKKFRAIRELNNGAYIEVNLSAKAIQKFCFQAIETIGLTSDEWQVDILD